FGLLHFLQDLKANVKFSLYFVKFQFHERFLDIKKNM
ncbi:hypothetical protein HNQ80_005081, partial [Anaerosolibacter carboniphilus]|nr:hypothetical protein [Anaerosolibacter carboniphilus]